MKSVLSVIFILILLKVNAQDIDSLTMLINKLPTDTEKVNAFYKEGFLNRAIDPQYSFDCAKLAEKYAQASSNPYYIAKASNLLGILYYRKNDLATALSYHKKALNLRTIINDKKGIATSETNLGNLYSELKKFTLAEEVYLEALDINNKLNDKKQVGNCLMNLGVLHTDMASSGKNQNNDIAIAKTYFEKAIENAKLRNDYELEASCLNNLAAINNMSGRFDDAIANAYNSIKIKELMDNEMEMADSYINISEAYIKKGDIKTALINIKLADSIIQKYNYTSAKVFALKIKSEYYKAEKNFEQAYWFLAQHMQLKDSLEKASKEINLKNNFFERVPYEEVEEANKPAFPYLFFNLLIVMSVLIFIFLFKFKR